MYLYYVLYINEGRYDARFTLLQNHNTLFTFKYHLIF